MRFVRQASRSISGVTLFFFVWLTLQPLQAAAQTPKQQRAVAAQAAEASEEAQYGQTLAEMENILQDIVPEAMQPPGAKAPPPAPRHGVDVDAKTKRLRTLHGRIKNLEAGVEQSFLEVEAHLKERHLPAELLTRHQEAVQAFHSRKAEFAQLLQAMERADDTGKANLPAALNDLGRFLAQHPSRKRHTPLDPKKLPFATPNGKVRAPKETQEDLKLITHPPKPVQVAAAELTPGLLAQADAPTLSSTPTPEDLAPTEDVQITQTIRDLAESLHKNPVEIHNWVRNHIEFLPTYGSIQGSDMTLQTQRGNAFDTASLLLALLRASNIPARYAYGTIQVPIEQVMNWVGGVTSPEAALDLLGQGGIPSIGVTSGGKIASVRLEHVWVEAYVDYIPSRGAKHKQGDTWVPLDASFKQYQYTQGMDISSAVPFDAQSFLSQIQQGATINETEGWVQNIDQSKIQQALTDYQTQVKTYIDGQNANATVGDVLGTQKIVLQAYSILMGTLPYKTLATGIPFASLPDSLRHKLRFNLYASAWDQALDNPLLSYSASLPSLAGKRVSLTYPAASPTDQAVIDAAAANYRTSLPAYLIHVQPQLKVEETVVATANSVTMADPHLLTLTVSTPWYERPANYPLHAGDFHVIGLNPSGITAAQFDARIAQHDLSQGNEPDYIAEMFHQIALGWWAEKYAFNDITAVTNRVVAYQLPSHTLAGAPLSVRYFFGIARSASYNRRIMDAKEDTIMAAHVTGENQPRRNFLLSAGQIGSYLEAGIYDQAFLMEPGHSMSTVVALKTANEQGIPIYTITQANAAMLGRIQADSDDIQDMRNALAAGLRVTTPQRGITVDNFAGLGYILEDPTTGAAAYQISGGRSGGDSPTGQFVYPMPQPVATPLHNLILRSNLRNAGASLQTKDGVVMGIVLPAVAPAVGVPLAVNPLALLVIVIIIALVIYSTHVQEIENRYPRISQVYRHYTHPLYAIAINATKFLLGSENGTLGNGVYFEEPPDNAVVCPVTGEQSIDLTRKYELKPVVVINLPPYGNVTSTPETRASAFVEIEITRAGYWDQVIDEGPNSQGVVETIFRVPFLYFGPWSVGIQQHGEPCY